MNFVGVEVYPEGKPLYLFTRQTDLEKKQWCIFESKEGLGMGKIKFVVYGDFSVKKEVYIRKATDRDIEEFRAKEEITRQALKIAREKISCHNLSMRLVATKYPLGKKKIIFYYTAKERIDFRKLIKDLASVFKVRIQMQQIGVRDEPQVLGGMGICGREVCCASFLKKNDGERLNPVTLEVARIQNLPLVSSKISGICGRLRCCLNFEYSVYSSLAKGFPSVGDMVNWQGEKVKVIGFNLLKRTVTIETKEGVKKTVSREEVSRK
ncbi:stage 0 sporulation protein [Patescibacteria group bacterium]|nr:stage 0 sporulation protein [Patescibacteria group bacterium]